MLNCLNCVECFCKNEKETKAVWFVWPDVPKGHPTFYTYMCTDCLMEALQHGFPRPGLRIERNESDVVQVYQITRIRNEV